MAAGTALAALSWFVFSLQVRAQIICYPTVTCEDDRSEKIVNVSSERDCCLMESTNTARSYMVPTDESSVCHPCIVIFHNIESHAERGDEIESELVVVDLLFELPEEIMNRTMEMQIPINPAATCEIPDLDLYLNDDLKETTITVSMKLSELPITIHCQASPGQTDTKVLEMSMMSATVNHSDAGGSSMQTLISQSVPLVFFANDNVTVQENSTNVNLLIEVQPVPNLFATILLQIFPTPNCTGETIDAQPDIDSATYFQINETSSLEHVSIAITNDRIVEATEIFCAKMFLESSTGLVAFRGSNELIIELVDDDSAIIGFKQESITVDESAGVAVLTVAVMEAELATNAEVIVKLFTVAGTADESDFVNITARVLVFSGNHQEATVSIPITDDTLYEDLEMFTVRLELLDSNVNISNNSSLATISIIDNDFPTVTDAVFINGVMTVRINVPEFDSDLHLCYQVRGKPDNYFNFVSDNCTSVNAQYGRVPEVDFLTFIDSINIVAIDDQGNCHHIKVNATGCLVTIDERAQEAPFAVEQNGILVQSNTSHVRVSVPNCEDNALVMRVTCHQHSFYNNISNESSKTEPINVIKFEVARGVNLNESSHGLLGQFWNIPVAVTEHEEEPNDTLHFPNQTYYVVNVTHPSLLSSRSFVGTMNNTSWRNESKLCIFVGFSQGGPTGEVADADDPVIEGSYKDYNMTRPFRTNFDYTVFDDAKCV